MNIYHCFMDIRVIRLIEERIMILRSQMQMNILYRFGRRNNTNELQFFFECACISYDFFYQYR